jgi:hypothetical protein
MSKYGVAGIDRGQQNFMDLSFFSSIHGTLFKTTRVQQWHFGQGGEKDKCDA